ncbi:MAG: hypothetical protein ACRDY7_16580 [Acidimicrobiia bacterium]
MERSALVTGSTDRVAEIGDALEKAGFTVHRADPQGRAEPPASVEPGTLSCYVQLPRHAETTGKTLVERVRQFLAEGLLTRFDTASAVLPLLAPDACVVLVAGNVPTGGTPDDHHARVDLLRVLARAVLAELDETDVKAIVVGSDRTAAEIAEIAWNRGDDPGRKSAKVAAIDPGLSYADWQREMLSMTTED